MIIKTPVSRLHISKNNILYAMSNKCASTYEIFSEKVNFTGSFNFIRNPNRFAVSGNDKLIATKNALGQIALFELNTGKIIIENHRIKKEGKDIYFSGQNSKLIFSANNHTSKDGFITHTQGVVCLLDISGNSVKVCKKFDGANIIDIFPSEKEFEFLVYCFYYNKNDENKSYSKLFKYNVSNNMLCDTGFASNMVNTAFCKTDNHLFFTSNKGGDNNSIFSFCFSSGEFSEIFDLGFEGYYVSSVAVDDDEAYVAMISTDTLTIIDIAKKEILIKKKIENIRDVKFANSNQKIVIATDEAIYVENFTQKDLHIK